MQNYSGELVDLYTQQKGSTSNRIIGVKNHASIQMNVVEVDKVIGRFNSQFKTCAICEVICREKTLYIHDLVTILTFRCLLGVLECILPG
uniref:Uncharacterized protein n=1 Tax=Piliocolobus tephrosceles TaxID=591936 RepID=A0A8C9HKB8_9PRIM